MTANDPVGAPDAETGWPVDELARRAGLSVDTIRFYQRHRLLAPPSGPPRQKRYGPEHLTRLDRIRELQQRRFSLAAIRALLDRDPSGLVTGLFVEEPTHYSEAELVERSKLAPELVAQLIDEGILGDPREESRRTTFDSIDLTVLEGVRALLDASMAPEIAVKLVGNFQRHLRAMDDAAFELLLGKGASTWPDAAVQEEFLRRLPETTAALFQADEQIIMALYRRTVQVLALRGMTRGLNRRS
jgi:DNA-binding transcriptional MerR regulator